MKYLHIRISTHCLIRNIITCAYLLLVISLDNPVITDFIRMIHRRIGTDDQLILLASHYQVDKIGRIRRLQHLLASHIYRGWMSLAFIDTSSESEGLSRLGDMIHVGARIIGKEASTLLPYRLVHIVFQVAIITSRRNNHMPRNARQAIQHLIVQDILAIKILTCALTERNDAWFADFVCIVKDVLEAKCIHGISKLTKL